MTREAERREERTLSWVLRHRRELIVADWQSEVCRLLEGRELPGPVLRDSIPALIDRVADHLERREAAAAEVGDASRLHASVRLDRGFDLDEAVSEYALLRTTILERARAERISLTHRELARLNEAIDTAVQQLIVRFTAARERTARALETIASVGVSEGWQVDALLGSMIEAFREATAAADAVAILVREGERLRVRAVTGIEALAPGLEIDLHEGFAGQVASGGPTMVECHEPAASSDPIHIPGSRCMYGVPMRIGAESLGVAVMVSCTAAQLSTEDTVAFRMVAIRAADAIAYQQAVLRERAAHFAALAFGSSDTLHEGVARLLAAMGTSLGWDVAAYWELDPDLAVLVHRIGWAAPALGRSRLVEASARRRFRAGEGLPGRTWASGTPQWIADVRVHPEFSRAAAASEDGLRTGVAFPLVAGDERLGVIELFSRSVRVPSDEALQLTGAIGAHANELVRRAVAQEQVRESEAFNAAVLTAALDCVIAMDASGVVTAWNPAAERTFGYTRGEAIGKTVAELIIPPHLREAHHAGLARYLATGHGPLMDRRVEITGIRKDGSEIPVELTVARVPLPGPPRFTAYLRDLTERVAAERTRERFVGILGHDLRNPLGAIHLGVEILSQSELSASQAAIVRRVGSSAARMTRMVQELLDFTRGRLGGGIPVTRGAADLRALAERVVDEASLAHPGRAVALEVRGDPTGEWDAERLMQVISNLLGNAIQHGDPLEPVRVRVDGRSEDVVLSVTNAAECPPAELVERLFDPFRRGDSESTAPGGGLGLGLYITREIVTAHGGRIDARCDDAEGFTVTVVLLRHASR